MSDRATEPSLDALRIRKERVHTTMLIELLVLLVFLAITFAVVTKDESSVSTIQAQLDALRAELKQVKHEDSALRGENDELKRANAALRDSLARWMDRPRTAIPASDQPIVVPGEQFRQLVAQVANDKAMIDERQKENATLRSRLAAHGGGTDLPNCPVTAGFLISVDLLADGSFQVHSLWNAGALEAVRKIPGALELAKGGAVSSATFEQQAMRVAAWGRGQPSPCGFRAQVTEHHSNLALYKRQVHVVERYFYVRRN